VACPRCGELAEPGQEVCLRCGALVGRAYRRPPGWRLPATLAALGVLLIGAGAGFGIAELTHDKGGKKKKPISLTPTRPVTPTQPPTTTLPTTPTTPPTTTTPTTPGTTTPTSPQTGGSPSATGLTTWPVGKSGWTVVLVTTKKRTEAESRARAAAGRQISAGLLKGADYAGFAPGEWIVFMGQYDTRTAAARAEQAYAAKGFAGKPRQITPKK
jgi:hypothetical protein